MESFKNIKKFEITLYLTMSSNYLKILKINNIKLKNFVYALY